MKYLVNILHHVYFQQLCNICNCSIWWCVWWRDMVPVLLCICLLYNCLCLYIIKVCILLPWIHFLRQTTDYIRIWQSNCHSSFMNIMLFDLNSFHTNYFNLKILRYIQLKSQDPLDKDHKGVKLKKKVPASAKPEEQQCFINKEDWKFCLLCFLEMESPVRKVRKI